MVGRVGDQDGTAGQRHRLAGKPQRRGRGRRRYVRAVAAAQRALRLVDDHEVVDEAGQPVGVPLAGQRRDHVPLRVDHGQRGPRLGRVLPPHLHVGVVQHRVRDLVPFDGVGEGGRVPLVLELRRMDTDDHEHVGVAFLQRAQLVEHVQAVDTAEGEEVQQDDLPSQVGQRERPAAGVEPAAAVELRCAYPWIHPAILSQFGSGLSARSSGYRRVEVVMNLGPDRRITLA